MNDLRRLLLTVLCTMVFGANSKAAEPPQPMVVGHRGLMLHAPENTLCNFRACLELRFGFEFDLQWTKDRQLVCIHDDTVDRATNGKGKVSELTLSEIKSFDAGRWFDPKFTGEKVPTVEEVFKLVSEYRQYNVLIAADIKAENVEEEAVRLAEKYDVLDRVLYIGKTISEPSVRRTLRKANPKAHVATVANAPDEFSKAVSDPDSDWVYVRYLPSKDEVGAAQRSGRKVFIARPCGPNVPANWRHATEVGVDTILTDYPLELRAILREIGRMK